MAVITRAYSEVDGQIAEASSVNRVLDDLYTLQAGNVDSSNIAASGINSSNYGGSSVGNTALQDSSVTLIKIAGSSVLNLVFHMESFG